jgi:hypothetical protein
MSCTRHFLNLHWEHHSWRPRVTFAETVPCLDTSMWGRPVNREFVRCQKQDVCKVCGKTRRSESCMCDTAHAERCAVRLAWIDRSGQAAGS